MIIRKMTLIGCVTLIAAAAICLGGCESDDVITTSYLRGDVFPGMATLTDSKDQQKSRNAIAVSTNIHSIGNDWDRFWFIDKPLGINRVSWR